MKPTIALLLLQAGLSVASVQRPFSTTDTDADEYHFDRPIQRVAVIGAGPSGIVAYRELTEAGFEVRLFERDRVPGGNWHYTDEIPLDAPVPNAPAVISDFVPSRPPANAGLPYTEVFDDAGGDMRRDHRGPKSIWESLTTNAATPVQQFPSWPWPVGTEWQTPHYQVRNYVRSYASYLHINSNDENPATAYNTRVEHVEKRIGEDGKECGWRLWLRSIEPYGQDKCKATWWTEDFDAVVVAAGKFSAPTMPTIPGLDDWVRKFPSLVRHSRQYRRPEAYLNQTVLIVGASISGTEVSRDLNRHVKEIYQSYRPDTDTRHHYRLENYMRRIPKNTTLIGEINQFLPIPEGSSIQSGLVELKNGTILSGFDSVILATGFRYSFPFLPQYYDDATFVPHEGSAKMVSPFLPPDGTYLRDLYLDLFYIEDPTLAFLGMTLGTQYFYYSDYTTLALAKVWSNTAELPSTQTMREMYNATVEERGGYGKHFMFLGPERLSGKLFTTALVRYFMGWLNASAQKYGGKQVDGIPKHISEVSRYWQLAHDKGILHETTPAEDKVKLASLGIELMAGVNQRKDEYALMYDDNW